MARSTTTSAAAPAALVVTMACLAPAQDGGEEAAKPRPPSVLIAAPFAVFPGAPAKLVLRGNALDIASAIEADPAVPLEILAKEAKGPPDQIEASEAGDSRAELTLAVPPDAGSGSEIKLVATNEFGRSEPFGIIVLDPALTLREDTGTDGFDNAQPVAPGQSVVGDVSARTDVDTFRLELATTAPVTIEVLAHRRGSTLDASLAIHDTGGHRLAWNDDASDTGRDPHLTFTPPAPGTYIVALTDANSRGTDESHPYVFIVRREAPETP